MRKVVTPKNITLHIANSLSKHNQNSTEAITELFFPAASLLEELDTNPENSDFQNPTQAATQAIELFYTGMDRLSGHIIDFSTLAQRLFIPLPVLDTFMTEHFMPIIELPISSAHDKELRKNAISLMQRYYWYRYAHSQPDPKQQAEVLQEQRYLLFLKSIVYHDETAISELLSCLKQEIKSAQKNYSQLDNQAKAHAHFISHYIYGPISIALSTQPGNSMGSLKEALMQAKRSIETIGKTFIDIDNTMKKLNQHIAQWVYDPIAEYSSQLLSSLKRRLAVNFVSTDHCASPMFKQSYRRCLTRILRTEYRAGAVSECKNISYLRNHFYFEQWVAEAINTARYSPEGQKMAKHVQTFIDAIVYSSMQKLAVLNPRDCQSLLAGDFNKSVKKPSRQSNPSLTQTQSTVYALKTARTPSKSIAAQDQNQEHKEQQRIDSEQRSMEKAEQRTQPQGDLYGFSRLSCN